jgi:hypothetical protein
MNIRNAYFPENRDTLWKEVKERGSQGKWMEAAVLLELALEGEK